MRFPTPAEIACLQYLLHGPGGDMDADLVLRANELARLGWVTKSEGAEDDPDDDDYEWFCDYYDVNPDGELALRLAALAEQTVG